MVNCRSLGAPKRSPLLLSVIVLGGALAAAPMWLPGSGSLGPTSPAVTWNGFTAVAAAASGEGDCIEGLNCDTFTLTVTGTAAQWAGKVVRISLNWTNQFNDFDLYVHKGTGTGPIVADSGNGAPGTSESAAFSPTSNGVGVYVVHVVYFAVVNGNYQGRAAVESEIPSRTATYSSGGITFSPNVTLRCPVAAAGGEPSIRTDRFGNSYAAAIRGVPAGTDLWYMDLQPTSSGYDPYLRYPVYRGQPDTFPTGSVGSVGADGGGDIDLAVGFGNTNPCPLATASLVAANISVSRSLNRGVNFTLNPVGSLVPVDDRQWLEAYGASVVYLYYRTISVPVLHFMQRSTDSGLTYAAPIFVGTDGQTSYVDVDQSNGIVYASRANGSDLLVATGIPLAPGLEPVSYVTHTAVSDPGGVGTLFAPVKVAADGTVYAVYSNGRNIMLTHSTNQGTTWALPVRVNNGSATLTSLFPWIETGTPSGSVGIVWYGTTASNNDDTADWRVFYARSANAKNLTPHFQQTFASDHTIHAGNISTGGLLGTANRNLLDYFQLSVDPTGAAVIAYTDDHNDFDGHTYVTRQISGPGLNGTNIPSPGTAPPQWTGAPDGSQVLDFAQDHVIGLITQTPTNSPFDILSIKYFCEETSAGRVLAARMTVSDLPAAIPAGNWRMNFTANAPSSFLHATGEYTTGISDRGQQFWYRASTDSGTPVFTFGTAVRNSDGSITYTQRGSADSGLISPTSRTITVRVLVSRLNDPLQTWRANPPIASASRLVGLRGSAFTTGVNAIRDDTRGGRYFILPTTCAAGSPPPPPPPPPPPGPIIAMVGFGSIQGKTVNFEVDVDISLGGAIVYEDTMQGYRFVSDSITSFTQTGPNSVRITGTGTVNGGPVNFTIDVEDNGDPGSDDFYAVVLTGSQTANRSGFLTRGNLHAQR